MLETRTGFPKEEMFMLKLKGWIGAGCILIGWQRNRLCEGLDSMGVCAKALRLTCQGTERCYGLERSQ